MSQFATAINLLSSDDEEPNNEVKSSSFKKRTHKQNTKLGKQTSLDTGQKEEKGGTPQSEKWERVPYPFYYYIYIFILPKIDPTLPHTSPILSSHTTTHSVCKFVFIRFFFI